MIKRFQVVVPVTGTLLLAFFQSLELCRADSSELPVVPAVRTWEPAQGTFCAKGARIVVEPKFAGGLDGIAKRLGEELKEIGCGDFPVAHDGAGKGALCLTMPAGDQLSAESYRMEVGDGIVIRGNSAEGVLNGTRTLLQLLAQDKTNCTLPRGTIVDWPQYKHRMLMLDVGRKPFPMPVLKDYLRILSWYKMNELHLHLSDEAFGGKYTGFRVQCDTFPGLASKDLFYTKKELREFQDEAKAMGITVTPEIDMPGHSRVFTDYWPDIMVKGNHGYMDVTNPRTIERMKQLLDEMIPIFDAPDFHIGTDEYRVGGPDKEKMHAAFREFINTMNAYIRSKGKNCRIWSGFENMGGKEIKIDPTVIIDMWDPYNVEHDGHPVINSSQFVTYYVPGAHYYGVNPGGLYDGFEPWRQGVASAPKAGDPRLLGGKLHVWNDQGPTGYTMTEIASLVLPGIQAISEKLWGKKGSKSYTEFQKRAAQTLPVPGITVLNRITPGNIEGLVLDKPHEVELAATNAVVEFPFESQPRADLECPWTLTMELFKTAETGRRGVILSSDLAEICSDFSRDEKTKKKNADGKEVETKVTKRGIGLIRAAGSPGVDPASSHLAGDVSRVYSEPLPLNKWTTITVVGERRRSSVYLDGKLAGETGEQMICPLARLGSKTGNSFVGKIRNLKVINRALTPKEIGRAAGLDIPDNLAAHCAVTASRSDTPYGLTPEKITDDDPGTRWSSGQGGAETWVAIDLGKPHEFNTVTIKWENAIANEYRIAVSDDGNQWRDVAGGAGKVGVTETKFPAVTARHIRINMSKAATGWGYSIWEVEVLKRR